MRIASVAALLLTSACFVAPPRNAMTGVRPAVRRLSLFPASLGALLPAVRFDAPRVGDRSVGFGGVMRQTVNEVVPIPGTDLVRAGAIPDGSLFQSAFRSPTAEAANRGGTSSSVATLIFKVERP